MSIMIFNLSISLDCCLKEINLPLLSPFQNANQTFVEHSMLFLPMARSSAVMPYFKTIDFGKLHFGNVKVSAMDFGTNLLSV